jgi:hypothetical protein
VIVGCGDGEIGLHWIPSIPILLQNQIAL